MVNPHNFGSSTKFTPKKDIATIENRLPETTKLVGRELLHVNHRFAEAIGWLKVQEYMKQTRLLPAELEPSTQSWLEKVAAYVVQLIRPLWIQVPVSIRAATYRTLVAAGLRQYGSTLSDRTFRLPFGLYLRIGNAEWGPKHQAEYETLRLVNKYTQIPAPKPIDVFQDSRNSYLVITRLPGQPVGQLLNFMSDQQIENFVLKLKEYVHELREIQNENKVGFQICNSIGGGILDWRIGDSQRENLRFKNDAEFHDFLTRDVSTDVKEKAAASHKVEHEVVFTHADLNPRNILVDERGRITGIVDWECAGWYPEYWEYTKAHFAVRYTIRWLADVVDQVFPSYRQELYVENMLSDLVPPW
jgi:aminoglycoside phosphotransferase